MIKILSNKKIIIILSAFLLVLITTRVFATWDGNNYEPGETLNPECLPSEPNCDIVAPITANNISDDAYTADWDGVTGIAPSKNSVYDKIETVIAGGHDQVTIGTANGLSLSGQEISLGLASSSTTGALSDTDWDIFNNKESALTFSTGLTRSTDTVTVNTSTGISGGQSIIGGIDAGDNLTLSSTSNATKGKILFGTSAYDEVNDRLGIGTNTPSYKLDVDGNINLPEANAYKIGGTDVLKYNSTSQSVAVGSDADISKTRIVAIGHGTGHGATGNYFMAEGFNAGYGAGDDFVAQGYKAGELAGNRFIAQGNSAGQSAGDYFVAQGYYAGKSAGDKFVAQGFRAGQNAGSNFVSLGYESTYGDHYGVPVGINDSIAIGYQSSPQFNGHFLIQNQNLNNGNPIIQGDLNSGKVVIGEELLTDSSNFTNTLNVVGDINATGNVYGTFVGDGSGLTGLVGITNSTAWNRSGTEVSLANSEDNVNITSMWINNTSGNVGINTTSPNSTLHVIGTVNATHFVGNGSGLTGISSQLWNSVGNDIYYDLGRVAIGDSSFSSALSIKGSAPSSDLLRISTSLSNLMALYSGGVDTGNISLGDVDGTGSLTKFNLDLDKTQFVFTGGEVGIGTDNPQNKLDVSGGVAIGADYSGTHSAPTNGLIVQGNVSIGEAVPDAGLVLDVEGKAGMSEICDEHGNNCKVVSELSTSGLTGSGSPFRFAKFNETKNLVSSAIYGDGSKIGINTENLVNTFNVDGDGNFSGNLYSSGNSFFSNSNLTGNLNVEGDVLLDGSLITNGGGQTGKMLTGSAGRTVFAFSGSDFDFRAGNGNSASQSVVRFLNTGEVGIGTDEPKNKLNVIGDGNFTGRVMIGSGTNSAPSITFQEDTDTGIYRFGANIMRFVTGATSSLQLGNSNSYFYTNLTISGKLNASDDLDVGGDLNVTGNSFGKKIYGELSYYNTGGSAFSTAGGGVFDNVTGVTSCTYNNSVNCTTDKLTINHAGVYEIEWSMAFNSDLMNIYSLGVLKNYNTGTNCLSMDEITQPNTMDSVGRTCVLTLDEGDVLSFAISESAGPSNLNIFEENINIERIG
ncbi:MAG: hypothetical protein U9R00_03070 [Patescibacteria group bacterium]|nr:hypothetical protein [Patescibacteria group bacterium]